MEGLLGMKKLPVRSGLIVSLLFMFLTGCALVKPNHISEKSTQVDRGLAGAYLSEAVVVPFDTKGDEAWGTYAARRLADYLMENRAFRQVVVAENNERKAGYIIRGTLEHLSYGGNEEPTTVFLTVSVTSVSDSLVRFQRSAKASSGKSAFHMVWLRSVDVPSPYIEELLDGILKATASDIASRTHSPAVQNP